MHIPSIKRRTIFVALITAPTTLKLHRAKCAKTVTLVFCRRYRTFGRRRSFREINRNRRVCGQSIFSQTFVGNCTKSQPAFRLRLFGVIINGSIFINFFLRCQTNRQKFSAARNFHCFENRVWINFLVKRSKHQRIAPSRLICRNHLLNFWRRRGECPSNFFLQSLSGGGFCSGGNADGEFCRHRKAFRRVEHQSFRPQPTPISLDLRRHFDGNKFRRFFLRSYGNHRL